MTYRLYPDPHDLCPIKPDLTLADIEEVISYVVAAYGWSNALYRRLENPGGILLSGDTVLMCGPPEASKLVASFVLPSPGAFPRVTRFA